EALVICHKKGVIHRDLKPHNILIEKETQSPILVDFGLAGQLQFDADNENLTNTGQSIGTPAFMAPEQVEARGNFGDMNQSTDVWGLMATLYYCLTGQAPYTGSTAINIISQLMKKPPIPPIHINKAVPPWLNAICSDSMQQKQALRPELETILKRFKEPDLQTKAPLPLWAQKAVKGLKLVTVAAIVFGLAYFLRDDQAPIIHLTSLPTDCGKSFSLSGEIIESSLKDVYIQYSETGQKRAIPVTDGQFHATIPSLEGKSDYQIIAIDSNGNQQKESFTITGHHKAPALSLTKEHHAQTRQVKLTMTASPNCEIQVMINDSRHVFKGPKATFEKILKQGLNTIKVTATGPYKNATIIEEVIESNQLIYTVGKANPGFGDEHLTDLSRAIKKASKEQANVLILPGVHNTTLEFEGSTKGKASQVKVFGLSTPEAPAVIESNKDITVHIRSGTIVFDNIHFRNTQNEGVGAVLNIGGGVVKIKRCHFETASKEKVLISTSNNPKAATSSIELTQCTLNGGKNSFYLGPNSQTKLRQCKLSQALEALILIQSCQLKARDVDFKGGQSAVRSNSTMIFAKTPSKIDINDCRFEGQRAHVFELSSRSELRCTKSTIDHKAKKHSSFWGKQKNKITVSNTTILNEGGLCFIAENDSVITANKCTIERPYTIGKFEKGGVLRMTNCIARSIQDTGFHGFERGRLALVRCKLINGNKSAISLCNPDSQTTLQDCLIRGFTQALVLNSPKPLGAVEIKGCRFEESKFIAIEIRGQISSVRFENNTITKNNLGLLVERLDKGGPAHFSIKNCEFKGNVTHGLLLAGPNINIKLDNCLFEDNARKASVYWGQSTIYVARGSQLEIRDGSIEKNEGPALHNHSGKIRVFPGVVIDQNKGDNKGVIQQD
ncbi:MAG: right-handed parallel beta-helix repeat-containing protein, partial [Planctomycetota bacterium]|nr:right-handed parallel beta-helix repeat-containing protein [Planctomycetota bacterium]